MNKFLLYIAAIMTTVQVLAQPPQKMSYQMVVRNSNNVVVANQAVGIRISLLQGAANGYVVFSEAHSISTNANGLVSFAIGEGSVIKGSFSSVDWSKGPYFLQTEVDPAGGNNYSITGTSQLMSVPYAMYSAATAFQGKTYVIISGYISNSEAADKLAAEVGPNTQFVWIQNTHTLTSINLSGLSKVIDLVIKNNEDLQSVTAPSLVTVENEISLAGNVALTTFSAPVLKTSASLRIDNCLSLVSMTMPALAKVGGDLSLSTTGIQSVSLPLLDTVGNIFMDNNLFADVTLPSLKTVDNFTFQKNTKISSLSLPFSTAKEIYIYNNSAGTSGVASIMFPNLVRTRGSLRIETNYTLATVACPSLIEVGYDLRVSQNYYGLTSVSLPALQRVGNYLFIANSFELKSVTLSQLMFAGYFDISENNRLLSLSLPLLKSVSGLFKVGCDSLTSLYVPVLDTVTTLKVEGSRITSLTLPALRMVKGDFNVNNNVLMTSLSIPQLNSYGILNSTTSTINFSLNGFSSATVNGFLNYLVNITPNLTSKNILLRQIPSAPPTGQGITDKTTLQSRGNTLTTN